LADLLAAEAAEDSEGSADLEAADDAEAAAEERLLETEAAAEVAAAELLDADALGPISMELLRGLGDTYQAFADATKAAEVALAPATLAAELTELTA
jgi:hypothetical protein